LRLHAQALPAGAAPRARGSLRRWCRVGRDQLPRFPP
ncbi:hypothetical protein BN1708_020071, partial [Verticillium longisporum]